MMRAAFVAGAIVWTGCIDSGPNEEPKPVNPNGLLCGSAFTTQGSWVAGTPTRILDPDHPDYAPTGCWPVGTWTFTATVDAAATIEDYNEDGKADRCGDITGTPQPAVEPSYSFRVDRSDPEGTGWVDTYTLTSSIGDAEVVRLKVTGGGGGECEGYVHLRSADGKTEWNLKPTLTGSTIGGLGDFWVYLEPQE